MSLGAGPSYCVDLFSKAKFDCRQRVTATNSLSISLQTASVMTLQNRVDPWGKLVAVSARGAWLGNRGILHNERKEIVVPWRPKSWVTCQLEYKGRQRQIFSPNNYSELFFLDEATAFSAGHRPCAECRRDRYNEFKAAWIAANPEFGSASVPIGKVDKQLHAERAVRGGKKVSFVTEFSCLPSGAFVELDGDAALFWQGRLNKWSPNGYKSIISLPQANAQVRVLTPLSIVKMYRGGFTPQVHESASD